MMLVRNVVHVVIPSAGVEVNVCMTAALVLGEQSTQPVTEKKTLDDAIHTYEEEMVPRAAKFAQGTLSMRGKGFSAESGVNLSSILRSHHTTWKS